MEGYRFVLHGKPNLHAIRPAFLTITVAGPVSVTCAEHVQQ